VNRRREPFPQSKSAIAGFDPFIHAAFIDRSAFIGQGECLSLTPRFED
jgi:hypothetical protein